MSFEPDHQGHSHPSTVVPTHEGAATVVLVGNPNVGKSVVFCGLTGNYVEVSNFPGTTVEIMRGALGENDLIDTPGIYGVSSLSDEERVARDVILDADIVINVVDAVHLERDLFLTLHLIDMGKRMIVALNMADEAKASGVAVDRDLLEDLLGVPVIETVATRGEGIDELKARALTDSRVGHSDPELEPEVVLMASRVGSRAEAMLLLEGDEVVAERHGIEPGDERDRIYVRRRERVNDLVGHVVSHTDEGMGAKARLSSAMMHPATGLPLLGLLLFGMYKVLGEWLAGGVVDWLEEAVFEQAFVPFVEGVIGRVFAEGSAAYTIIAGEFGVLTMTPMYLFGVILPLVTGFYILLALLEDSGYLPRIAALADRSLSSMGLNGRAIIPFILGLGCVTMGTLTTRILGSKRERVIATALMAIAIPCSAQIAVIAALMAGVGPAYAAGYFGALVAIFVTVGTALHKITPGVSTDLLIDLPTLRIPRLDNVLRKSFMKVYQFMKEVTLFFVAGALLISILEVTGALGSIQALATPLTVGWLGLPADAATAFVMGFVRRDFGAAGFFTMSLTAAQLLVAMVTITLFVPCIASVMVIWKERGPGYVAGLFAGSVGIAFVAGGLLARLIGVA